MGDVIQFKSRQQLRMFGPTPTTETFIFPNLAADPVVMRNAIKVRLERFFNENPERRPRN